MRRLMTGSGVTGWLILGGLLGLIPAEAGAQSATGALRRIDPGGRVRVATPAGRFDGRLGLVTTDSVTVQGEAGRRVLALDAIRGVWSPGNRAGTGALVGGVAGAVLGVLYATAIREVCEGGCDGVGFPLAMGGLLGAGGAAAGALIGLAIPRWVRRFP